MSNYGQQPPYGQPYGPNPYGGQPYGRPGQPYGQGPYPAQPTPYGPAGQPPYGPGYGQPPGQPPYGQSYGQPAATTPPRTVDIVQRSMPVVTIDSVPGRQITEVVGEVVGVVARSRELPPELRTANPVEGYIAMLTKTRQDAVSQLVEMAAAAGADAIVGLRFDSSEITQSMSEVAAYGTAVRLAGGSGSDRPGGATVAGQSTSAEAAAEPPSPAAAEEDTGGGQPWPPPRSS